jgi:hypothetical protein
MQKNSINAGKCKKIPLMQKNAEKFHYCRKIPLMQKNSINSIKFHFMCFVIQVCSNPSPETILLFDKSLIISEKASGRSVSLQKPKNQ